MVAQPPIGGERGQSTPSGTWSFWITSGRHHQSGARREKFDPTRGYKFHYTYWWIRQDHPDHRGEEPHDPAMIHITEMLNKPRKVGGAEQELGRTPPLLSWQFVEPEDDVKDLMCRARQPVSLEMKVGDGDDTVAGLLSGDGDLP